ncbi:MAG: DNA lyase [Acidobacteria bacterium]|nr:MAG: DNA lyase [Acidobacteriota bacterium]
MPEGDTIFRAARTLNQALAGRTVTRFDSVFSHLTRVDDTSPVRGRRIERVDARGKHLLIWFSGDLVLRTHMRMHGSWHIYRPGERWQRPRADMRIVIATPEYEAVAFSVPVAELTTARDLERTAVVRDLGPDILADEFDTADVARRIEAMAAGQIAEALLDQFVVAGIGNIFKSESLFAARVDPFAPVAELSRADIERVVDAARRLMRASATQRTAPFSVYGRAGRPCRRCGTPISRRKQGEQARVTYWCAKCQGVSGADSSGPRSRVRGA